MGTGGLRRAGVVLVAGALLAGCSGEDPGAGDGTPGGTATPTPVGATAAPSGPGDATAPTTAPGDGAADSATHDATAATSAWQARRPDEVRELLERLRPEGLAPTEPYQSLGEGFEGCRTEPGVLPDGDDGTFVLGHYGQLPRSVTVTVLVMGDAGAAAAATAGLAQALNGCEGTARVGEATVAVEDTGTSRVAGTEVTSVRYAVRGPSSGTDAVGVLTVDNLVVQVVAAGGSAEDATNRLRAATEALLSG